MVEKQPATGAQPLPHRANNADSQLATVREYAQRVFGKDATAAAWLGQLNPRILNGRCTVAEACQTTEGFLAAMLELARVNTLADARVPNASPREMLEGDLAAVAPTADGGHGRPH